MLLSGYICLALALVARRVERDTKEALWGCGESPLWGLSQRRSATVSRYVPWHAVPWPSPWWNCIEECHVVCSSLQGVGVEQCHADCHVCVHVPPSHRGPSWFPTTAGLAAKGGGFLHLSASGSGKEVQNACRVMKSLCARMLLHICPIAWCDPVF